VTPPDRNNRTPASTGSTGSMDDQLLRSKALSQGGHSFSLGSKTLAQINRSAQPARPNQTIT
jgi:hypothetical protein